MPAGPQWLHNGHGDDSLAIQISDFCSTNSLFIDFDLHQGTFNPCDSERVVSHFSHIVDAFLAEPERPVRLLSLVSDKEAKRILEWSDPGTAPLDQRCVHQIFEEKAGLWPDALAVVFRDSRLSYHELNRRANQLACYLRKRSIGPGTLVGLCVERSLEMIVGLLGILKAGAAYVPIHPEYPKEWINFVLADTGVSVLLTQDCLLGRLPSDGPELIALDLTIEALSRESAENIDSGVTRDDLAYVIYTSGSTGNPKGVQIPHRALMNFAVQAADAFGIDGRDRVLQFASIAFDTSIEEIFPCLMRGGTLVLRTDTMLESTKVFVEECGNYGVTVLDLPTSYWHEFTARLFSEHLKLPDSVRAVIIGGERVFPARLTMWQECVDGKVKLFNTYGPTETTVSATIYDLTGYRIADGSSREIPIGRPLPNVQTYVLDRNLTPVPVGVAGELHIAGAGLACGYLNQPGLSADKFIRNPFSEDSDSRLFKTGDLVRYRPDGPLEYLGRVDRQVKIRGFRVELDGIEAVLREHPLVKDAAVVLEDRVSTLVAYLVPIQSAVLNTADVKRFIRTKLPEHMLPTKIVVLDSIPLTDRGKVDQRALPVAGAESSPRSKIFAPPQTHTEERIAGFWCEVLGLEDVGRHDHFFEIGGQSLLAAQIVSRIRKELHVEIPLRLIFESPTVAQLAKCVDETLARGEAPAEVASILPTPRLHEVPASASQMRIWYMHQLAPDSAAYNIAAPIRFIGPLNKNALARSLGELIRSHESLRTTFRSAEGTPVQIISEALNLDIPETDLRAVPVEFRIKEAKRILSAESQHSFDLEKGPLIRVLLICIGNDDHVLLLNMHHVISDQWSLAVIAREVTALYNHFCKSTSLPKDELRTQYADFAIWQHDWLTRERLDAQHAYWKTQLANLVPLALPTDHPRPSVQTFHGAYHTIELSSLLMDTLKRHAAEENASLYMIFLAAFKVLLYRYTSQEDVAIGSPIANRSRLEWERVVGTFINILVLRTNISGNPTFRQVLRRVREVVLEAFTNSDAPFETLVKELQSGRDPSRAPLVQVLFNFQSTAVGRINLLDLSWMPFEIEQCSAQFDLSVTIDPEVTRKILIAYNTDLYKAETVSRMLQHYQTLLEAIAADPDQSLGNVNILRERERRQLLFEWNRTEADFPQSCIHHLFEERARRTPDSIAVIFEDEQISYRELEQRANQVACRLTEMGVSSQILVAVCIERSIDLIAALLGVLKAGGAYLPIDPAYPAERIDFMLEDSGAAILLTQENLLNNFRHKTHSTLCFDAITRGPIVDSVRINSLSQPSDLAYVIYTSGSTGKPKGVEIEHSSLVNFLNSMRKKLGISECDVMLSVTTVSFDIAALEFFLPLTVGARLIITRREVAIDAKRLKHQIETSNATMMQATPTTWRMLTEAGWQGSDRFKALCGGESLPLDLARRLLKAGNTVWNLYGPTETTVWSTACQLEPNCESVSIGKPIDNTRVYILDRNMEPVPAGIVGELYIGGVGVARGYLKRPELTAQKFLPDPYGKDSNARLYKTGDLGRFLSGENIEHLGRMDSQLKIRGHRIEPEEIEATLREHPEVTDALVAGMEFAPGDKRLAAYVVTRDTNASENDQLRSFLLRKLPEHMVPSAIVRLQALPIAPGGKVNRQALPVPGPRDCCSRKAFVAPRDRLELQLAQIWQLVIGLKSVGILDNFFELGGHSLTVIRVVAEIKKQLRIELPIAALFAAPTIEQLAGVLRSEGWAAPRNCIVEIKPGGSKPPLFFVGFGYSVLQTYLDAEQPVYGLSLLGMLNTQVNPSSIKEIAASFIESIRTVQPFGPYQLAGHSAGGLIAFEVAHLLVSQGEKISLLALLDTYGPRSRRLPLLKRVPAHWRALKSREQKERIAYLAFTLCHKINKAWNQAVTSISSLRSVQSVALASKNLSNIYDAAFRDYVPQVFPGHAVLLRSRVPKATCYDDAERGWTDMFMKGLEVYEVSGDHRTMLHEPQVRDVAAHLNECLKTAQTHVD
jgi:amino acid adenylation domain-containing protein